MLLIKIWKSLTNFLKTGRRDKGPSLIIDAEAFKAAYERLRPQYLLYPTVEALAKELGVDYNTVCDFLKRFPEIQRQYPTQGSRRPTKIMIEDIEEVLWMYIEESTGKKVPSLPQERSSYLASLNRAYLPPDSVLSEVLGVSRTTIDNFARKYPERIRTRERGAVEDIADDVDLDKLKRTREQRVVDKNI